MKFNLASKEEKQFDILCNTVDENYKVFHLFSRYLNEIPSFVTKDIIDDITSSCKVSEEYAFAMTLSSLFNIDSETKKDDRLFERNRIIPAIKKLDINKFTNNPYYKNITIPNIDKSNWTLKNEVYDAYRGFICEDIFPQNGLVETPTIGFFSSKFNFPAILENENEWMTLTPADLNTSEKEINEAYGNVITFGLGLGYYAYMVSNKLDVSSVTIVEKDINVISLFNEYILPQFPNKNKITVINDDAFEYAKEQMPKNNYNYAFVDTWRDASDGLPMYNSMKKYEKYNKETKFTYWIEGFILSRMRSIVFENIRNNERSIVPLDCDINTMGELHKLLSNKVLSLIASQNYSEAISLIKAKE